MSAFDPKTDMSGRATVEGGGDPGVPEVHPYYESHRSEMEASMRMRLDLIDDLLQQHLNLTATAPVKNDMMREFEVVLTQMRGKPDVRFLYASARIYGDRPCTAAARRAQSRT